MSQLHLPDDKETRRSDRILGGSMVFVALRCTTQYILLPFVLPLFGLSNAISVVLSAILEVFALSLITYNLVRLWDTSWRWRYLALSVVMVSLIGTFLYFDIQHWLGLS